MSPDDQNSNNPNFVIQLFKMPVPGEGHKNIAANQKIYRNYNRIHQHIPVRIGASGGTQIYVDTSQRFQYAGIRRFYESCGYRLKAVLENFHAAGDGKAIYSKSLE